jgi:hypothetical protein
MTRDNPSPDAALASAWGVSSVLGGAGARR